MKVYCEVDYCELENDNGRDVPGVIVTCGRCGHQTEAFGQHEGSVKRCMVLLKEECPNGERNFYEEGNVTNSTGSWNQANGGLSHGALAAIGAVDAPASQAVTPGLLGAPQSSGGPSLGGGGHSAPSAPRKFSVPGKAQAPVRPLATLDPPAPQISVAPPGGVPRLIAENDFCIVKCATTGLSTEKDEIVQIGLCQVDKGIARWRVSVNVKPTIPIPTKASEIHGLTAEKLQFAAPFSALALELVEFIGERVLIGYNIGKFDVPILTRQLGAVLGPVEDVDFLDVLLFERKFAQDTFAVNEKQRHGLEHAIARWLPGLGLSVTHDALNDAKAVWAVFVTLCARFPELGQGSLADAFEILKAEGALTAMGLRTAAKFAHLRR